MQIEKVSETVMASSNQEAAALEQRLPDADMYVCKINVHIYIWNPNYLRIFCCFL